MNLAIKEATVKRYHYDSHAQLKARVALRYERRYAVPTRALAQFLNAIASSIIAGRYSLGFLRSSDGRLTAILFRSQRKSERNRREAGDKKICRQNRVRSGSKLEEMIDDQPQDERKGGATASE